MAGSGGRWVRVQALSAADKALVSEGFERLIAETLKPRFLPEARPTQFNYPIDIFGKWRGSKYSFITRYRSGHPDNAGEEFDTAFTRLDHVQEGVADLRFDAMWHRPRLPLGELVWRNRRTDHAVLPPGDLLVANRKQSEP